MKERIIFDIWAYTFDFFALCILFFNLGKLKITEYIFLFSILLFHPLLYYSMVYNKYEILDILHFCLGIFLTFGFFTNNIYVLLFILSFILVIIIFWIFFNNCLLILITENKITKWSHIFGKEIVVFAVIVYFFYLCYKIGYLYK